MYGAPLGRRSSAAHGDGLRWQRGDVAEAAQRRRSSRCAARHRLVVRHINSKRPVPHRFNETRLTEKLLEMIFTTSKTMFPWYLFRL